jgi:hypothetical protein
MWKQAGLKKCKAFHTQNFGVTNIRHDVFIDYHENVWDVIYYGGH